MQPPSYYPISLLPSLTGRSLARCLELVEAGLVRSLEVPFGDKAKDDGGRRKAKLVPAGRVRAITQIPEGEIAPDPDADDADRIARIVSARADEVVRVRRMKDSSFGGFEVEVPFFTAIFPTERETLLMAFVRLRAEVDFGPRQDEALAPRQALGRPPRPRELDLPAPEDDARLLEIGQIDRVVHVAERIAVAEAHDEPVPQQRPVGHFVGPFRYVFHHHSSFSIRWTLFQWPLIPCGMPA